MTLMPDKCLDGQSVALYGKPLEKPINGVGGSTKNSIYELDNSCRKDGLSW